MLIEEYKCSGTTRRSCTELARYVTTTANGQRFSCRSCSRAPKVSQVENIGEWAAQLFTGGDALLLEEQERVKRIFGLP